MALHEDFSSFPLRTVHVLVTAHPDDESLFFLPWNLHHFKKPGPCVGHVDDSLYESCIQSCIRRQHHLEITSEFRSCRFRQIATLEVNSFTLSLLFSHSMFHAPHIRDPRSNQMKFTYQPHNGPSICYTNYRRCMFSTYCS
jgi:hypothetical protein